MSIFDRIGTVVSGRSTRVLLVIAAAVTLGACDTVSNLNPFDKGSTYKPEIIPEIPAERLYNDGLALIERKEFEAASEKFRTIDKQFPFSDWARKALLMETFANFSRTNYDETVVSGKRYLSLYPASPDAAYAAYMVANAYYNAVPDVTRDQERSEKALVAFSEIVERWPTSEYATDSKFKVNVLKDQLAGREMTVGRYYLKKRNYTAAINRFRVVVSNVQTTNQIEEALARLAEAYLALGIVNEAETAAAVLGHNFPDSQWYKDTYALLESKGTVPRENEGSWISKAFGSFKLL